MEHDDPYRGPKTPDPSPEERAQTRVHTSLARGFWAYMVQGLLVPAVLAVLGVWDTALADALQQGVVRPPVLAVLAVKALAGAAVLRHLGRALEGPHHPLLLIAGGLYALAIGLGCTTTGGGVTGVLYTSTELAFQVASIAALTLLSHRYLHRIWSVLCGLGFALTAAMALALPAWQARVSSSDFDPTDGIGLAQASFLILGIKGLGGLLVWGSFARLAVLRWWHGRRTP